MSRSETMNCKNAQSSFGAIGEIVARKRSTIIIETKTNCTVTPFQGVDVANKVLIPKYSQPPNVSRLTVSPSNMTSISML